MASESKVQCLKLSGFKVVQNGKIFVISELCSNEGFLYVTYEDDNGTIYHTDGAGEIGLREAILNAFFNDQHERDRIFNEYRQEVEYS